ncbi:MarR family winged helix-turn-helix transcriptional regulator [Fodinibius sp. Rm-B-1B1-1]|uniref:MarR family winged helix-turn-helix transcriptional regulator n=1 Tax=Fodinibius alkaliphilus TaxID=3140241 RepID=UPI00315AD2E2
MADIIENNLFYLTGALSRKLTNQADDVFATVGLSSSHALLLWMINDNPNIQPSQLANQMQLKPSTITRLVQKLERRGLVEKKSKGRAIAIRCTDKGGGLAQEIQQKWDQLIQQKKDQLGDRYVEVLSEMIANAISTVERE